MNSLRSARSGLCALPNSCRCTFDFIQRRGLFQSRYVAEFVAQIRCAHDATHDLCVSRFWYVADKNDFLGSEHFARLDGERVF